MERITSFIIGHNELQPGIYVSRKDQVEGRIVTTFDLKMASSDEEPVVNITEIHTIEHLGTTFLRNHGTFGEKCVYFSPMGCRTSFYLLLAGDYESTDIPPLMMEMYELIRNFEGEVPGTSPENRGSYLDMSLGMARFLVGKYLDVLYHMDQFPRSRLVYPK